ncbi:uncharacterized protein SCHCODRAFT_02720094, partial [Schizophyllum commune H4-8]|uniref:uncharacterized protein n=1 Tax=Schizophyllum commune (strain H4-8 / FGSC 9210) TaxID=578458 RepID=UPI00215E5C22
RRLLTFHFNDAWGCARTGARPARRWANTAPPRHPPLRPPMRARELRLGPITRPRMPPMASLAATPPPARLTCAGTVVNYTLPPPSTPCSCRIAFVAILRAAGGAYCATKLAFGAPRPS